MTGLNTAEADSRYERLFVDGKTEGCETSSNQKVERGNEIQSSLQEVSLHVMRVGYG